jgi:hypothetical protein
MAEQPKDAPGAARGADAPDERVDLERVLSTLEGMLASRDARADAAAPGPDDQLPLLSNVVVPGDPARAGLDPGGPEASAPLPPHEDLVQRLASEIEVIIEGCMDEALRNARKQVMAQLSRHLEIVLPEILEELERRRDDPHPPAEAPGDPEEPMP